MNKSIHNRPKGQNRKECKPNKALQFLIYNTPQENVKVDVVVKDETLFLTQKSMAALFDVGVPAVSKHIKNIFAEGELDEKLVVSILEITTQHGAITDKTQNIETKFYSLDAVIAVGYCVKKLPKRRQKEYLNL